MTRSEANQLRALGCVICGAALLLLAWGQYGAFTQGRAGALGWCAGLAGGALAAFALAVWLRWRGAAADRSGPPD